MVLMKNNLLIIIKIYFPNGIYFKNFINIVVFKKKKKKIYLKKKFLYLIMIIIQIVNK